MLNRKIFTLTESNSDIIFLTDVRANGKISKLEKKFLYAANSYLLHSNSSDKKRGTAILFNKKLNCEVLRTFKDLEQNILAIKAKIRNIVILLICAYGPNNDRSEAFYTNLQGIIDNCRCEFIIFGGDLNTTLDPTRIQGPLDHSNLDLFNMNSNINPLNCERLNKLLRENKIIDPFRIKNPNKRDYRMIERMINNSSV